MTVPFAERVEDDEDETPATVALALDLLRVIAEDPGLRPSHRIAARRHFNRDWPRAPYQGRAF